MSTESIQTGAEQLDIEKPKKSFRLGTILLWVVVAGILALVGWGLVNANKTRPELHRAVVFVPDCAACPCNDAGPQKRQVGRIEEVDVALFVIPGGKAETRKRPIDLMIRNGRLELY